MSQTTTVWDKSGLTITIAPRSKAKPLSAGAYKLADLTGFNPTYIYVAVETVTSQGRNGIRVTNSGVLPSTSPRTTFSLFYCGYQGAAPSALNWVEIPLTLDVNENFSYLVENPLPLAVYRFKLRVHDGEATHDCTELSINTPDDSVFQSVSQMLANISTIQGQVNGFANFTQLNPAQIAITRANYQVLLSDQTYLQNQVIAVGMPTSSNAQLTTDMNTLTSYLNALTSNWTITNTNVTIVPETWSANWNNVINDMTTLEALIQETLSDINNSSLSSGSNRIPNGTSELGPISGIGGQCVLDTTGHTYPGYNNSKYVRSLNVPGSNILPGTAVTYATAYTGITPAQTGYYITLPKKILCSPNDQFSLTARVLRLTGAFSGVVGGPNDLARLIVSWCDSSGNIITGTYNGQTFPLISGTDIPTSPVGVWTQVGTTSTGNGIGPFLVPPINVLPGTTLSGTPTSIMVAIVAAGSSQFYFDDIQLTKIVAIPASATVLGSMKVGAGLSVSADGTVSAIGGGGSGNSGTVTSVSFTNGNGFLGSISNATSTPDLTLSVSPSGLLKGSGGSLVTASASDITSALGFTPINKAGDTGISGDLIFDVTGPRSIRSSGTYLQGFRLQSGSVGLHDWTNNLPILNYDTATTTLVVGNLTGKTNIYMGAGELTTTGIASVGTLVVASGGNLQVTGGDASIVGNVNVTGTLTTSGLANVAAIRVIPGGNINVPNGNVTIGGNLTLSGTVNSGTVITSLNIGTQTVAAALNATQLGGYYPGAFPHETGMGNRTDFTIRMARSGFYQNNGVSLTGLPNYGTWWNVINGQGADPTHNYALQLASEFSTQRFHIRSTGDNGSQAWSELVTTSALATTLTTASVNYATSAGSATSATNASDSTVARQVRTLSRPSFPYLPPTDGVGGYTGGNLSLFSCNGTGDVLVGAGTSATLTASCAGDINYAWQLSASLSGTGTAADRFHFRRVVAGAAQPWTEIITSSNIATQNVAYALSAGNVGGYGSGSLFLRDGAGNNCLDNTRFGTFSHADWYGTGCTYSYASGTPWTGIVASFGGLGTNLNYAMQINSDSATGSHLSFRTRTGTAWNPWRELIHSGNTSVSVTNNTVAQRDGTGNLNVASLYATGPVYQNYSDGRLKENIRPIDNALGRINNIRGVFYTANALAATYGYIDQTEQTGVIAQEVAAVLPQVVAPAPFDRDTDADGNYLGSKSGEGYSTVQYERLIPLLIEGIKEQQVQIDALKALVSELSQGTN